MEKGEETGSGVPSVARTVTGGPVQQQQLLPTLLGCAAARGGLSRRATKPSRVGNQLVIGTAVFSGCGCRGTGNPAVL